MPIYAIFLVLFGVSSVLFWSKWVNSRVEYRKLLNNKVNADLQQGYELKRLNEIIDEKEVLISKFMITVETIQAKVHSERNQKLRYRKKLIKHGLLDLSKVTTKPKVKF